MRMPVFRRFRTQRFRAWSCRRLQLERLVEGISKIEEGEGAEFNEQ